MASLDQRHSSCVLASSSSSVGDRNPCEDPTLLPPSAFEDSRDGQVAVPTHVSWALESVPGLCSHSQNPSTEATEPI